MSETPGGSVFDDEPQGPTFACPNCGHSLPVGTPICGNCGTVLQGGTSVPTPLAASGIRPGTVIKAIFFLAVLGLVFFGRGRIADVFDSVGDAVEDATEADPPGGGEDLKVIEGGGVEIAYRNIGAVVRDIRAGGVRCTDMRVDVSDEFLSTGSCQSDGRHVQITLYYQPQGIEFAKDFYAEFAFASVHADNWWVSGDTPTMRRIQGALGGKLHVP